MSSIESAVLQAFYARLEKDERVSEELVTEVRSMLGGEKLPKADELASLVQAASGDQRA